MGFNIYVILLLNIKKVQNSMWTSWIDINLAKSKKGPYEDFGIYQIRAVNKELKTIPIERINGLDREGVLYIGRSGFKNQRTNRTIANRINEFIKKQHSGGITYGLAKNILRKNKKFSQHNLQVRALFQSDNQIELKEAEELHNYFLKFAELPPCNSAFPGLIKDGYFDN